MSDHMFALAHALGIRFAPRIPNQGERRLYAFGAPSTWPALAPFIAGKFDEKAITAHWDDTSIMPDMPSCNTAAPTMAIAEEASDLILGRPPPEPAILA